ncbi:regulatory protein ada [Diabrotica virgifera virgifera]|uniref:Methylated-DNA--protein-cysteine methyltransferase n=1 Tax=Diabrotica virgifera virgifera TaxID=50390 RepID=A0A6P7FWU9_DIAVI|nr:regulatory protein ada [Diabrotica virgifera virgifera]
MSPNFIISKISNAEYKEKSPVSITYGKLETKYGKSVLAFLEKQICFVSFGDDFNSGIKVLQTNFPTADFTCDDSIATSKIHYFDPNTTEDIKLILKGTEFEIMVWEYLLQIKEGTTVPYEEVAKGIGKPTAVRAVANAIGKNNIAFFIPCHRVISKTGDPGKYGWGRDRKLKMLADENVFF